MLVPVLTAAPGIGLAGDRSSVCPERTARWSSLRRHTGPAQLLLELAAAPAPCRDLSKEPGSVSALPLEPLELCQGPFSSVPCLWVGAEGQ